MQQFDASVGAFFFSSETSDCGYDTRNGFTTMPAAFAFGTVRFSPYHFTGKERDTESGNDYFFARYYASSMGRFLSPDWSAKTQPVPYAKLDDPQTLNLYGYLRNNPLGGVDADGHCGGGPNEPPCTDVNVTTVKVVQPGTGSITLDGQPQYGVVGGAKFQVTQGGKPLVGAPVSESNTTTRTVNGKPEPGQPHPKSTKTGPDGGVPDLIGDTKNTDGSAASTAAAKSFYDTSTVVSVTDQILTISAPGCTASFTDTRTVTSTPGQAPTITVTDPKPVPPPPPPPKPKTP
jgi:RHS repeat-associated protein